MRLRIVLPKVAPEVIKAPTRCAYAGCSGRKFHLRKARHKTVARHGLSRSRGASLPVFARVNAPFGSLPKERRLPRPRNGSKGWPCCGICWDARYGATSLALEALGVYVCKSRVYDAVQETAKRVPGLKREQVFAGVKTPADSEAI